MKGAPCSSGPKGKAPEKHCVGAAERGPVHQLLGLIVPSGKDSGPLISLLFAFLPKRFWPLVSESFAQCV